MRVTSELRVDGRILTLALTGVLVACGGNGESAGRAGREQSSTEVSGFCRDATLAIDVGQPLDLIYIQGLNVMRKERSTGVFSAVYSDQETDEHSTPIVIGDEGQVQLVVPVHSTGINGGRGKVRLTDDQGLVCPWMDLEIQPIPPAPGETLELVRVLEQVVRHRINLSGTPVEAALTGAWDDLPLAVVPQAMALRGLVGDGSTAALETIVEQEADELSVVDALLHKAGVIDALQVQLRQVTRLSSMLDQRPSAAVRSSAGGTFLKINAGLLALMQAPRNDYTPVITFLNQPPVDIDHATDLSRYMNEQVAAGGAVNRLQRDALKVVPLVVGVASKVAACISKYVVWLVNNSEEGHANLLPCCFESIDYKLEKTYFEEDYPLEAAFLQKWHDVEVVARNRGWNATDPALGLIPCVGELAALALPDIESLEIPPYTWPAITLEPATSWCKASADGAITVDDEQHYIPTEVGVGKLTVETKRGEFGHAHKALAKLIDVKAIHVSITPSVRRVEPEETVELRAVVRNSFTPELLKWKAWTKRGRWLDVDSEFRDGVHHAKIKMPREEASFPVQVEAESTSRTGLRRDSPERRYGSATLTTGVVVDIGPEPACVRNKPRPLPLQMFAEVVGTEDTRLKWRVVSGPARINSDGQVTATGEGEAVVRGTSVADDRAWDEATIDVGKCTCSYSAILSGDTNRTNVRGGVAHFSTQGKTTIMGTFTNPEALKGIGSIFGVMQDEEGQQTAEEWQQEAQAMKDGGETLGIALMEMDPAQEMDDAAAMRAVGGFKLQASVMGHQIEPGFAGGLDLDYIDLHTGEYTEGGYPTRYQWAPGAPGNVSLIINHYNGRALSGTITGNMFAPGLYKESTREPPQISFSIYFDALDFDPMGGKFGCLGGL